MVRCGWKGRPDGRRYEGYWQNGKQHGQGVYYNAQGRRKDGEWNEGKRVRWINEQTATTSNGP